MFQKLYLSVALFLQDIIDYTLLKLGSDPKTISDHSGWSELSIYHQHTTPMLRLLIKYAKEVFQAYDVSHNPLEFGHRMGREISKYPMEIFDILRYVYQRLNLNFEEPDWNHLKMIQWKLIFFLVSLSKEFMEFRMSKAAVQESGLSHDDIEDIDGILDSINDLVTINLDDLKVTAVLHLIFLIKPCGVLVTN